MHHEHFLPTQRCAQVQLLQRLFGSTVTHWPLHSFSWPVPFSVGYSCQKACRTADRSPPAGLQLAFVKAAGAYTNVQGQEILLNNVAGPGGQRRKKDLCRQRIVHIQRTPKMHSGRGGGVAAVQCGCIAWSDARVCGRKRLGVANNSKTVTLIGGTKRWKVLFKQRK